MTTKTPAPRRNSELDFSFLNFVGKGRLHGVMESSELLTTNRKALTINLDQGKYGTFAEIGAGQEVARHFFQAGGASGTVAKSISAYDMKFSDEIYGKTARYVSVERLGLMLEHEYDLLLERLGEARANEPSSSSSPRPLPPKASKGLTRRMVGWAFASKQHQIHRQAISFCTSECWIKKMFCSNRLSVLSV